MIISSRDPATLSCRECLREIATILAQGYLRFLSQDELDVLPPIKASCKPVNNKESNLMEDVA